MTLHVPAGWLVAAAAGVVTLLIVLAAGLRRSGRGTVASRVTVLATVLGLAWSAQGMWDTAVRHYRQDVAVASVLFVVFEAMMCARMLRAHEYRHDRPRRVRHVRAVWVIAVAMALVVALGEGWAQAPARLAIPLLVAYGWWTDLTADDDPAHPWETSWRWPPRRIGLALGLLEPGERDARTGDRDRLRDRMTRLAFRERYGSAWLSSLLRRRYRLARLATVADADDLRAVSGRLDRAWRVFRSRDEWDITDVPDQPPGPVYDHARPIGPMPDPRSPAGPPEPGPVYDHEHPIGPPCPPCRPPARRPAPRSTYTSAALGKRVGVIRGKTVPVPLGATVIGGQIVSGVELNEIARDRYRASIAAGTPMSQRELAGSFDPPMSQPWAKCRIDEIPTDPDPLRVNGSTPAGVAAS